MSLHVVYFPVTLQRKSTLSQSHLSVITRAEHSPCPHGHLHDRQIKHVLGTWEMQGRDNPAFTFKLSFWQSLSNRLLNQRSGCGAPACFHLATLYSHDLERALNWKLLHIKPSARWPGSKWINILPATINQILSLSPSLFPLCFFEWL